MSSTPLAASDSSEWHFQLTRAMDNHNDVPWRIEICKSGSLNYPLREVYSATSRGRFIGFRLPSGSTPRTFPTSSGDVRTFDILPDPPFGKSQCNWNRLVRYLRFILGSIYLYIWIDHRSQRACVLSDSQGILEVYWRQSNNIIDVASTPFLLVDPSTRFAVNHRYLRAGFSAYSHFQGLTSETMFEGISRVPSGMALTVEGSRVGLVQSVDPRVEMRQLSQAQLDDWQDMLRNAMTRAVNDYTDNRECALLLSGGIDSSLIAGAVHATIGGQIVLFTENHKLDRQQDESVYAATVADHWAFPLIGIDVQRWLHLSVVIDDQFRHPEPSLSILGIAPLVAMYRCMSEYGCTRVLAGNGAEHIFEDPLGRNERPAESFDRPARWPAAVSRLPVAGRRAAWRMVGRFDELERAAASYLSRRVRGAGPPFGDNAAAMSLTSLGARRYARVMGRSRAPLLVHRLLHDSMGLLTVTPFYHPELINLSLALSGTRHRRNINKYAWRWMHGGLLPPSIARRVEGPSRVAGIVRALRANWASLEQLFSASYAGDAGLLDVPAVTADLKRLREGIYFPTIHYALYGVALELWLRGLERGPFTEWLCRNTGLRTQSRSL